MRGKEGEIWKGTESKTLTNERERERIICCSLKYHFRVLGCEVGNFAWSEIKNGVHFLPWGDRPFLTGHPRRLCIYRVAIRSGSKQEVKASKDGIRFPHNPTIASSARRGLYQWLNPPSLTVIIINITIKIISYVRCHFMSFPFNIYKSYLSTYQLKESKSICRFISIFLHTHHLANICLLIST